MSLIYIDVETTGLDPNIHQVWEIAVAVESGPIIHGIVPHSLVSADPEALEVNNYDRRTQDAPDPTHEFEEYVCAILAQNTLAAANPAFDSAFLRARWGGAPWKYRLLDVEAYAMGALGYEEPQGLSRISDDLRDMGWSIPRPDHTAAGDVATLRACHLALRDIYAAMETDTPTPAADAADSKEHA